MELLDYLKYKNKIKIKKETENGYKLKRKIWKEDEGTELEEDTLVYIQNVQIMIDKLNNDISILQELIDDCEKTHD